MSTKAIRSPDRRQSSLRRQSSTALSGGRGLSRSRRSIRTGGGSSEASFRGGRGGRGGVPSLSKNPSERITKAIQKAVLQKQEELPFSHHRESKIRDRVDPVGEHLTSIFNSDETFRGGPTELNPKAQGQQQQQQIFSPILSSRNIQQWKIQLNNISSLPFNPTRRRMLLKKFLQNFRTECEKYRTDTRERKFSYIVCSILLFVSLKLLLLGTLVTISQVATFWIYHVTLIFGSYAVFVLVDLKDLKKIFPQPVVVFWGQLLAIFKWIDNTLLLGKRFVGREWNKHDFEWNGYTSALSCNADSTLWTLPPPSIKEGRRLCLNEQFMSRDEWSSNTTKHIVGINFCYVMMRDDYILKQTIRSRERNKARIEKEKEKERIPTSRQNIGADIGTDVDFSKGQGRNSSRVISLSSQVGDNTGNLWGLSNTDPQTEGIELVQETNYTRDHHELQDLQIRADDYNNEFLDSLSLSEDAENKLRSNLNAFAEGLDAHSACSEVDSGIGLQANIGTDIDASTAISPPDSERGTSCGSVVSYNSDVAADMNWIDLGTKIGIRLLNSAQVQRAVASQETAERIMDISKKLTNATDTLKSIDDDDNNAELITTLNGSAVALPEEGNRQYTKSQSDVAKSPARPVHSMWTSASAAAVTTTYSSFSDIDDCSSNVSDLSPSSSSPASPTSPSSKVQNQSRTKASSIERDKNIDYDRDRTLLPPRSPAKASAQSSARSPARSFFPHSPPSTSRLLRSASWSDLPRQSVRELTIDTHPLAMARSLPVSIEEENEVEQMENDLFTYSCSKSTSNDDDDEIVLNAQNKKKESVDTYDTLINEYALPERKEKTSSSHPTYDEIPRSHPTFANSSTFQNSFSQFHSNPQKKISRRLPLQPGVKVVVPMFPIQPGHKPTSTKKKTMKSQFQMGTVISSRRIFVGGIGQYSNNSQKKLRFAPATNCLSVTCTLDKSFLRNGEFSKLTFRVMDEWNARYMPKHSKVPIGSCVATSYGIGVLVGWRVEDDCHVIRSLWQRRGPGSAHAYLTRDAIKCVVEAAVGFDVETNLGSGNVLAYVNSNGGKDFRKGQYVVSIQAEGERNNCVVNLDRSDILSCVGTQFITVIEHIREAANYQIQVENYKAALREQKQIFQNKAVDESKDSATDDDDDNHNDVIWKILSNNNIDIFWNCFLKAVDEDKAFDEGVNSFMSSIINFLERIDRPQDTDKSVIKEADFHNDYDKRDQSGIRNDKDDNKRSSVDVCNDILDGDNIDSSSSPSTANNNFLEEKFAPGMWILNDIFGGLFHNKGDNKASSAISEAGRKLLESATLTSEVMNQKYRRTESHDDSSKSTAAEWNVYGLGNYIDKDDCASVASSTVMSINTNINDNSELILKPVNPLAYKRAYAIIRILLKTVTLARADSSATGGSHFRLAMTICFEFLSFIRTVIKVQQKNVSPQSLAVWGRALEEIKSTFGPMKERLEKIGRGILQRMERQGRKAKIRLYRFFDALIADEVFFASIGQAEWDQCVRKIEAAMIKAKILDEDGVRHYRKTANFIYNHLGINNNNNRSGDVIAASHRNNEKLQHFIAAVQCSVSPRISLLKMTRHDKFLEFIERILVRVFHSEEVASRMLMIHTSNFHSLRHLRILKDLSVSGRLWIPLLDAADAELSWVVSNMPENAKELMCPLSSLFSLFVAQFHKIINGQISKDWLAFLMDEEAVRIIHDIDVKLILWLESFSRDVKKMMVVLPYYSSFDDDILNLMDEVELDEFLKEASEAIDDSEKLSQFIREKATIAIEKFLGYLPKMSIPVERRDLGDGWVLTCRGEDGGDLTLSDVKVKRENLTCEVMGGDALFFPMFADDDADNRSVGSSLGSNSFRDNTCHVEISILDQIRELLAQAERYGCWQVGIGGVGQPPTDHYIASVLQGFPVTSVLNCAIELWRNLEIDDDELLEIAIRDVSFQIQLHDELKDKSEGSGRAGEDTAALSNVPNTSFQGSNSSPSYGAQLRGAARLTSVSEASNSSRKRFNPRIDPTVLFLEMKNLTLHLEKFRFRIEKNEKKTVFDPVFEGYGTLSIQNVSILLRVECARERIKKSGTDVCTPVLLLRELDVQLESVKFKVKDTGADWLFNKAVNQFSENITSVVEANLKEQISKQTKKALQNINSYFMMNPDTLLSLLGITMDDLEEYVIWV